MKKFLVIGVVLVIVAIVVLRYIRFRNEYFLEQKKKYDKLVADGKNPPSEPQTPSITDFLTGNTTGEASGGAGGLAGILGGGTASDTSNEETMQKEIRITGLENKFNIQLTSSQRNKLLEQDLATLDYYLTLTKDEINSAWYSYYGYNLI